MKQPKTAIGKDGKTYTKASLINLMNTNDSILIKGLLLIHRYQTQEEKRVEDTIVHNNVGFTGSHGKKMTGIANWYLRNGSISPNQLALVRRRMPKYANQLLRIMAGAQ